MQRLMRLTLLYVTPSLSPSSISFRICASTNFSVLQGHEGNDEWVEFGVEGEEADVNIDEI